MSIQHETKHAPTKQPMLVIDRRDEKRKNVRIIGQILAAASGKSRGAGGKTPNFRPRTADPQRTGVSYLQFPRVT